MSAHCPHAKQFSDQMHCTCGNVWDMNDPSPPACRTFTLPARPPYVPKEDEPYPFWIMVIVWLAISVFGGTCWYYLFKFAIEHFTK